MLLPQKYKWLQTIGPLPQLVGTGLSFLGIHEIAGHTSNPIILGWARDLGIEDIYKDDDMSWCALAMSEWCHLNGKPLPDLKGDRYNYLRAAWFLGYGEAVPKGAEMLGDIGVWSRPGGNHVGLIIAENPNSFHVLGGNQSNSVSIVEISRTRFIQARRYYKIGPPESVKKYILSSSGVLSTNEA